MSKGDGDRVDPLLSSSDDLRVPADDIVDPLCFCDEGISGSDLQNDRLALAEREDRARRRHGQCRRNPLAD